MSTHNICFCRKINKILCGYPILSVAMVHVQMNYYTSHQEYASSLDKYVGQTPTVLSTSLGKTFFAWRFILNENILF